MIRMVFAALVLHSAVACGAAAGDPCTATGDNDPHPRRGGDGVVHESTPEGVAAMQVVLDDPVVKCDEEIAFQLVNRGDVELETGLDVLVKRWNGQEWSQIPPPENTAVPSVAIILRPGRSTDPQRWSTEFAAADADVRPGSYRIEKTASYWDPDYQRTSLVGRAYFEIRGN